MTKYSDKIKEWADAQGDPIRRQFANGETFEVRGVRKRGNWECNFEPVEADRPSVLDDAKRVITGERQDSYGNPEDSFGIIAEYWSTYIEARCQRLTIDKPVIRPVDVANMMILFKQARKLGQKPCRDNSVDSCGYEAIYADRLMKWGEF